MRPSALARRAVGVVPRPFVVGVLTMVLGSALLVGVVVGVVLSVLL
jgi:hypothetical protein